MHELAIVDALIEQVQAEVAGVGGRVTRIELVIGRLSGVCPDSIRFGFEVLSRGTPLEAAAIDIRQPPAVCSCRECGAQSELQRLDGFCPVCASPRIAVEGGQDLVLQSIELEDEGSVP